MRENSIKPSNEGPACTDVILSDELNHCHALLEIDFIIKQFEEHVKLWSRSCYRVCTENTLALNKADVKKTIPPVNRILCYLQSYDKPQNLHDLRSYSITLIMTEDLSNVLENVKIYVVHLKKNSVILHNLSKELFALNEFCKELLPKLYKNASLSEIHLVRCSTGLYSALYSCSKPAIVNITIEQSSLNIKVGEEITANRITYNKILANILSKLLLDTVEAIGNLSSIVKHLIRSYNRCFNDFEKDLHFIELCKVTFFELAESCDEKISSYSPAMEIMRSLIISLGICLQNLMKYEGIRIIKISLRCESISNELCALVQPLETNFDYYLRMYEIVIESELKVGNIKIKSALLSKFDMQSCIRIFRPNPNDIRRLIRLVFTALEKWHTDECVMTIYRRQLIEIFELEFPRFQAEIIKLLLTSCCQKRIKPIVIRDIINSFLEKDVDDEIGNDIYHTIQENIKHKNSLNLNSLLETLAFIAGHFQNERFENGMHSIYSMYEEYCEYLSILFCYIGHQTISTFKKSFTSELNELFLSKVLAPLFMMYNPWICVYIMVDNIQDGIIFYPWSEPYIEYVKMFLHSLAFIIKYCASIEAISNTTMTYTFNWYVSNFTSSKIPSRFRDVICYTMNGLPWHCYYPSIRELETIYSILIKCDEENINFFRNVFCKIGWIEWISLIFANSNILSQDKAMHYLLSIYLKIFLKINFLHLMPELKFSSALLALPWHRVPYSCLEDVFNQIKSENPLSVLKLLSEENELDFCIESLLKKSCAINHENNGNSFNIRAKRLLYVREVIELASKSMCQAESSSQGQVNLNNLKAVLRNLMETVGSIIKEITIDLNETNLEAVHLLFELINAFNGQNNLISDFFMDLMITWQAKHSQNENLLFLFFEATAMKRLFEVKDYHLLESTIDQFFKNKGNTIISDANGWIVASAKLRKCFELMDPSVAMQRNHLHVAHLLVKYNLENGDDLEKSSFISKMIDLLKMTQISEELEPKLAILWGGVIGGVIKYCVLSEKNYQKLLLMAESLLSIAHNAESWSNKLLGMVGVQYSAASQKFIFLSKFLASLAYIFCNRRDFHLKILQELKLSLNQKRNFGLNTMVTECIEIVEESQDLRPETIVSQIFSIIYVYYRNPIVIAAKDFWQEQLRQ